MKIVKKSSDNLKTHEKASIFMRFFNWIAKGVSNAESGAGQCKG
jgi:hypothetical protein